MMKGDNIISDEQQNDKVVIADKAKDDKQNISLIDNSSENNGQARQSSSLHTIDSNISHHNISADNTTQQNTPISYSTELVDDDKDNDHQVIKDDYSNDVVVDHHKSKSKKIESSLKKNKHFESPLKLNNNDSMKKIKKLLDVDINDSQILFKSEVDQHVAKLQIGIYKLIQEYNFDENHQNDINPSEYLLGLYAKDKFRQKLDDGREKKVQLLIDTFENAIVLLCKKYNQGNSTIFINNFYKQGAQDIKRRSRETKQMRKRKNSKFSSSRSRSVSYHKNDVNVSAYIVNSFRTNSQSTQPHSVISLQQTKSEPVPTITTITGNNLPRLSTISEKENDPFNNDNAMDKDDIIYHDDDNIENENQQNNDGIISKNQLTFHQQLNMQHIDSNNHQVTDNQLNSQSMDNQQQNRTNVDNTVPNAPPPSNKCINCLIL